MIHLLDNLLRQLFIEQIAELTNDTQVRFQPPDADWRTFVANAASRMHSTSISWICARTANCARMSGCAASRTASSARNQRRRGSIAIT